jgi:hypothetical protein
MSSQKKSKKISKKNQRPNRSAKLPKIGDLWLWTKLPPMIFCYTQDGWMLLYADLEHLCWLVEQAEMLPHVTLTRADHPPPNARRYA